MNDYAVLLFGENYLITVENAPLKTSFFVWRCVHAVSQSEAEAMAVQMVSKDTSLSAAVSNSTDDPP